MFIAFYKNKNVDIIPCFFLFFFYMDFILEEKCTWFGIKI